MSSINFNYIKKKRAIPVTIYLGGRAIVELITGETCTVTVLPGTYALQTKTPLGSISKITEISVNELFDTNIKIAKKKNFTLNYLKVIIPVLLVTILVVFLLFYYFEGINKMAIQVGLGYIMLKFIALASKDMFEYEISHTPSISSNT